MYPVVCRRIKFAKAIEKIQKYDGISFNSKLKRFDDYKIR